MLTILSTPNVRHISWCLGSHIISAGRDPKTLTAADTTSPSTVGYLTTSFNGQNPTLVFNGRIPNWRLFKILKCSLLDMMSSTLVPFFLSGVLLWQMVIVISFAHERNYTKWLKTLPNWMIKYNKRKEINIKKHSLII